MLNLMIYRRDCMCCGCSYECTINEEKATVKRDKIKEGMTQLLDSLQEICGQQSEKNKAQKKIFQ